MNKLMVISLNSDPVLSYGTEHNGGQSKYILELGKNLVRENWDIDVFTIKNSNCKDVELITEGFVIYRFSLPENQDYSYSVTESDIDWVANSIINFVNENKFEYNLILCCYWISGIVGLKLKEIVKKNTLITFCSLGYSKREIVGNSVEMEYRINREIYIARHIDHIIATSKEEKKILTNFYQVAPNKITVIPRGVDTNKFCRFNDI